LLTIGWFSTGRDEAARQLLQVVYERIQRGEIDGEIAFVFSNQEPSESRESDLFFEMVYNYHIPLICFSSLKFKATQDVITTTEDGKLPQWRLEYDREIMKKLQRYTPDICILAGYMLIVEKEMCHRYNLLNLHPAAPHGPKGSWQEVTWALIESKSKESGVMMHLVTPELDRGPVITYCTFPIAGEPFDKYWQEIENYSIAKLKKEQGENNALFRLIRQHELVREFPLIVSTLKTLSQRKIKVKDGNIFNSHGKVITGYNLNNKINKMVGIK